MPRSWTVKSFVLIGPNGNVIATERDHPLVVCPFSNSIDKVMPLDEFKRHVISDPQRADDYIFHFRQMYRHWEKEWAISLPHKILEGLEDGQYRVKIATKLEDAPMPVLEYHIEGAVSDTICLVAHFDHPGMVNDLLSGCIALLQTVEMLEKSFAKTRYSYRLLLVPEHIGSVTWLLNNQNIVPNIRFTLSANMTAHDAPLCYVL